MELEFWFQMCSGSAFLFAELDFPLVLLKTCTLKGRCSGGDGDRKGANQMLSGDLAIKIKQTELNWFHKPRI